MRKTKTIYLIIGCTLLLSVLIIFIFLLTQAFNTNASTSTTTATQTEPKYTNEYKIHATDTILQSTQPPTETTSEINNIIHVKGLYVDKSENVYDADDNKYSKADGYIAIVYEGEVYKISVKQIKEVNPKIKETKEKTKATEYSDEKEEQEQQSILQSNGSQTNQSQSSGNVNVSQKPNVTVKPNTEAQQQNKEIKLNCSTLTIPLGTTVMVHLKNADNGVVSWSFDNNALSCVQSEDNWASFESKRKGTTQLIAKHLGKSYYCTITTV